MGETFVNPGGLMRCCTATLADTDPEREVNDGDVITCVYCSRLRESLPSSTGRMVLEDGVWRWLRDNER